MLKNTTVQRNSICFICVLKESLSATVLHQSTICSLGVCVKERLTMGEPQEKFKAEIHHLNL